MEIPCPHCGQSVPEEASFCLHCFSVINVPKTEPVATQKNKTSHYKKIIIICTVALAVTASIFFVWRTHTGKTSQKSAATTATTQTTQKPTQPPVTFTYESTNNGIIITACNTKQTTVTIPDKVNSLPVIGIRENALGENIQHLHISTGSQSVTVDEALFRHLPLLKTLTLPARFRIKRFPACLLACAQLESVTVQADNADGFHTENGVLYQKNALIFYPPAKKDVSFTIPETATSLKESAFNHARFTTLTFNKSSTFECDWETLFAALPQLESIRVYPGSSADLVGAQYFSGEIVYYE